MTQKAPQYRRIINNPDFDEAFSWGRDYYQSDVQDNGDVTLADILQLVKSELSPLTLQRDEIASKRLGVASTSYEKHLGFVAGFLAAHAEAQTASPTSEQPVDVSHKIVPLRRS